MVTDVSVGVVVLALIGWSMDVSVCGMEIDTSICEGVGSEGAGGGVMSRSLLACEIDGKSAREATVYFTVLWYLL